MTNVTAEVIIDAPVDRVWQVIAYQFDRIGEWATAISASTERTAGAPTPSAAVDAPVAGRVCHTEVRMVPRVAETVIAYDESARELTYEAIDGLPAFVTSARNRWQVSAITDTRTRVAFHAEVDVRGPIGVLARWWLLAQVGRDGRYLLADLKHYLEQGGPSPRKQRRLALAGLRTGDPVAAVGVWPTTRRLRAALRANSVFSFVSGLVLLAAGWLIAEPLGVRPAVLLPLAGAGVALFAGMAAWVAVQPATRMRRWGPGIALADLAWAAASAALLVWYPLTGPGIAIVGGVAAIVAGLAVWELAGLAACRTDDPFADIEIVQSVRVLPAPPAQVWPLLADHHLYGRLAPNLSMVEVISEAGQPLRRRCTNTAGNAWEETCMLWEDGRRFTMDVDTSNYPYPLELMRGLWQVDPDPGGSQVTMRFTYRVIPSVRGSLFAIGLQALFPPVLNHIFRGWQRSSARRALEIGRSAIPGGVPVVVKDAGRTGGE